MPNLKPAGRQAGRQVNYKRQKRNKTQKRIQKFKRLLMSEISNNKPYDLEERTFLFAKDVRLFIKTLDKTIANIEDAKQVVRSSGSVAANYIEANEALSKKDFVFRAKVSRKETKESVLWLRLINETNELSNKTVAEDLIQEAKELEKILSAIIDESK